VIKTRFFYLIFTLLMVGICLPLFAGGGQEEQLAQAETFIEQSRYDEAKELLTRIAAENPSVRSTV
jgi:hypothetical protein